MIKIEVTGIPRPGGGKMPFLNTKTGKLGVRPNNPNTAPWRADVAAAAVAQYHGPQLSGPVRMAFEFRFPRPKHHFKGGKPEKGLKANAPLWHTIKPDLTKIIRSTEDALTGIVWTDDCLVCKRHEVKLYCNDGERPGVTIRIFNAD